MSRRYRPLRFLWQLLRWPLLVLAVLVVFIEEVGWQPLAAWAGRVARWPPIARGEALIVRASPRVALVLFLVPAVLLFPIKLLAIGLMHAGRPWLGVGVLLLAKLLGTAFVGRLFVLLEPQLMQFERFRRTICWWRETRRWLKASLLQTAAWRQLRALLLRGKAGWHRMVER